MPKKKKKIVLNALKVPHEGVLTRQVTLPGVTRLEHRVLAQREAAGTDSIASAASLSAAFVSYVRAGGDKSSTIAVTVKGKEVTAEKGRGCKKWACHQAMPAVNALRTIDVDSARRCT
jgi:hypothetical protein